MHTRAVDDRVQRPADTGYSQDCKVYARCEDSNGAHVHEVTARDGAQTPTPAPTPAWGLHLLDANLSLGNPISIVASESKAYVHRHRHK